MLSRSTTRLSLAPIMVWPVTKFGDVPSFNLNMGRDEWRRHARHVFGCEYLVSNWFVSRCYCCSCCCCHRHVAAVILSCFCLLLHSNSNTVDVMLLSFCCFHADVILLLPWCWCHTAADILLLPFCNCHSVFAMLQLPCLPFCCFHTVVIDSMLSCVMLMAFCSWPCCDFIACWRVVVVICTHTYAYTNTHMMHVHVHTLYIPCVLRACSPVCMSILFRSPACSHFRDHLTVFGVAR